MIVTQTQRKLHEDHLARRAQFFKPAPRLKLVPKADPPPASKPVTALKIRPVLPGHPAFIGPLRPAGVSRVLPVNVIMRLVAQTYAVEIADLIGPRGKKKISGIRQIGYWVARQRSNYSLPDIGRRFGGRDHTSVMYGVRKVEARIQTDREFAAEMGTMLSIVDARIGNLTAVGAS